MRLRGRGALHRGRIFRTDGASHPKHSGDSAHTELSDAGYDFSCSAVTSLDEYPPFPL